LVLDFFPSATSAADAPQWSGAAPNTPGTFRFVVMSDNTGGAFPGEWEAAVREINLLRPDFVMCVGDLIEGGTADTNALHQTWWPQFEAMLEPLAAPFYYVAGNHDISNPAMRPVWLARYGVSGESYYSFDRGGCHFVVLDSATAAFDEEFTAKQLAWLTKDVAAARQADHVFVFYHHPQWENTNTWPALAGILPAGKTTIFNGHWHKWAHHVPDEIPTYVLGATGAHYSRQEVAEVEQRDFGLLRMYALVTVDAGRPTVAVLPLHNVLPGDHVPYEFTRELAELTQAGEVSSIAARGGSASFRYHNTLAAPLAIRVVWDAPGWVVTPAVADAVIAPDETGALEFSLQPRGANPVPPAYTASYETTNPGGRRLAFSSPREATYHAELDIPAVRRIKIDGQAGDWRSVRPLRLETVHRIFGGRQYWQDNRDLSATIRVGHDAKRLYACVEVTDDQIALDGREVWENDAIEFYWDTRPAEQQDSRHGPGTGQVILAVPAPDQSPTPSWQMGGRPVPEGLITACGRTPTGYVYELSVPLASLGARMPAARGQQINVEFQFDDRDVVEGQPQNTYMTTSGQRESYLDTSRYARGTLR